MKSFFQFSLLFLLSISIFSCKSKPGTQMEALPEESLDWSLVLHGGAGYMSPESLGPEQQAAYLAALDTALQAGIAILEAGGSSPDAVVAVISYMEDHPLFNAGRGAVFTHEGHNELDASIMYGPDLNAGAVAGVRNVRHPIAAARAVMDESVHVLLSGAGASEFAESVGLEIVDPTYFSTDKRMRQLHKAWEKDKHGTVGCVALDREGNLCAGTSTGGMSNKRYGRIGDSPIIGAGTYANNATCGVSATGHGEYFIRWAVTHDISALMEYKNMSVVEAAEEVVMGKLVEAGGAGGVVCLDSQGRPAMVFNTSGMFRAYGNSDGVHEVAIFKD